MKLIFKVGVAIAAMSCAAACKTGAGNSSEIAETKQPLPVLTQRNGGQGIYIDDLEPTRVKVHNFGKLRQYNVDGLVYAQPLIAEGVNINNAGVLKNVLLIATNTNKLYAFDVNDPSNTPLWPSPNLGAPMDSSLNGYGFFLSRFKAGIMGTPAISGNTMYLVAETGPAADAGSWPCITTTCDTSVYKSHCCPPDPSVQNQFQHKLYAIDIKTGQIIGSPRVISGSAASADITPPQQIPFNSFFHLQRPGLLVQNGVVYVAFGANNDEGPFFGWLFAFNATTLAPLATVCTTCAAKTKASVDQGHPGEGGIWQAGTGLTGDGANSVFFMTGNGAWDADPAGAAGNSIVYLDVTNVMTGNVTWKLFRAGDEAQTYGLNRYSLHARDLDLGSAGPLLAGSNVLLGAGKEGLLYVLDWSGALTGQKMKLLQDPPIRIVTNAYVGGCGEGALPDAYPPPAPTCTNATWSDADYPHIHGTPLYWPEEKALYVWAERDYLRRYHLDTDNKFTTDIRSMPSMDISPAPRSPNGGTMPGGMLSLSHGVSSGAMLWAAVRHKPWAEAGPENYGTGTIRALNPSNLTLEWEADQPFLFPKFPTLTIHGGRVYAPTNQGQVQVFGKIDRPVSVVSPGSALLEVFFRSTDGNIRHKSYNAGWKPTQTTADNLGGPALGTPLAISVPATSGPSRLEVFIRGTDGHVYHKARTGTGWQFPAQSWQDLGGPIVSPFTGVSWGPNRIDLFGEGSDGHVYTRSWDGTNWLPLTGWSQLGSPLGGEPMYGRPLTAISRGANRIDLFGVSYTDKLYMKTWEGGPHWIPSDTGWSSLGGPGPGGNGPIAGVPSVVSWAANRLDVIVRGSDGNVWWKYWDGGPHWVPSDTEFTPLGAPPGEPAPGRQGIVDAPRAVSWGTNRIDVFVQGIDGRVYTKSYTASGWTPSWSLLCSPSGSCTDSEVFGAPEPVKWGPNRIDIFARGTNSKLYTKSWAGGPTWVPATGWTGLGDPPIDF